MGWTAAGRCSVSAVDATFCVLPQMTSCRQRDPRELLGRTLYYNAPCAAVRPPTNAGPQLPSSSRGPNPGQPAV
ncbi:hypothetical protein F5X98DRAFT_331652 [Xylaria grammica]|nr:hypothetical protein F5X98DRAFT_331652 [Xylaria grammica]